MALHLLPCPLHLFQVSLEEEDVFEDAISTPDTPTPTAASHQPGQWERDLMLHFQDLNNFKF